MGILDTLKKIFPKPKLQKRYVLAGIGVVAYCLLKLYVASTPTTADDQLPDKLREAAVMIFASGDYEDDPSSDYDDNGMRFGERS